MKFAALKTSLGRLRVIGWWEGWSFLVLLGVAMPLKYFADWPLGVRVVGMAHGGLFMLYLAAALQAALEHDWPWKRTAWVLVASVLPAGPFVVDARVLRAAEAEAAAKGRVTSGVGHGTCDMGRVMRLRRWRGGLGRG